jgi:ABC-type glycerol-3-phosphate transport system substrate-binding protein
MITSDEYIAGIVDTFDCFTYYAPFWSASSNDVVLALDSLAAAEGADFLADFDQPMLAEFTRDGKLYGLPASSQPQIMAYNADLLEKRGLQLPSYDWTFEDFVDLATRASSTSEGDVSYGTTFYQWDDFLLVGRGVKWIDTGAEPPVPLFHTPEFKSGIEWIKNLHDAGVVLVQTNDNWSEVQQAMESGQVAFWSTQAGQSDYGWFYNGDPSFKVGIVPLPSMEDAELGTTTSWSADMGHYISAGSNNVQACWSWLTFLSEQPGAFSGVPARKSVSASPVWEAKVGAENARIYREALARVTRQQRSDTPTKNDYISTSYYTWMQRIVIAVLSGEDYQKLLDDSERLVDDYLACVLPIDRTGMTDDEYYEEIQNCAKQADPAGIWADPEDGTGGGG